MWSLPLMLVAALLQGVTGRPYAEERQLLDRHLAQLGRALPEAPSPEEDAKHLQGLASESGLRNVEIDAPTITETGSLGQSRRTLHATSTFPDADRFFRAIQASPRLIDVESVVLRPADFGVQIETRLRVHHRAARATPARSLDPARTRNRTRGASKEEAARFARDEQIALEKTIALDELRRRQNSPRLFLAETGAIFRDAAAALSFGSVEGETGRFALRGVVAGMGAAEALERRLEGGFFRLREFTRALKDGCYQFEAMGESFRAGPQAALPVPVDEPFRPLDAFCRSDRDTVLATPAGTVLRATGPTGSGLSLRAVDADLADIAAMLEALSREPLVIAEEVRGRVTLDVSGVSVDEALKALPVRVERVGTVRLLLPVSAGVPFVVPEAEDGPPPSRIALRGKRLRGEEAIAALSEAEPSWAALGPPNLGRVSIFARDAAGADVRRAALAALRLGETREDGARVLRRLGPGGGAAEPSPIVAPVGTRPVLRAHDLAVEEMGLVGLGRMGSDQVAFVYSPLGELVALRNGDALSDGAVGALDANGVVLDTSEGPVRISLALPRPR